MRWGHTSVQYEKYMFVFGGCGKSEKYHNWETVYRLDCETFEWFQIRPTVGQRPEPRDSHSSCCIDAKMYIYGGSTSEKLLNELWSFDLQNYIWKKVD